MPLVPCPECRREISDQAIACPQCGFPRQAAPPPVSLRPATPAAIATPPEADLPFTPLQEIAYRQKLVLYSVLINLLCLLPMFHLEHIGASLSLPPSHPVSVFFGMLSVAIILATAAFSIWCYWKLGRALRWPWPLLVVLCVGLITPGLALFFLISIVGWATNRLRKEGVRVGLMGADLGTVP